MVISAFAQRYLGGGLNVLRTVNSIGLAAKRANSFMGTLKDSLGLVSSSCDLATQISRRHNPFFDGSSAGVKLSTVSSVLSDTSSVIGMSRCCALWTRLLTGNLFWEVDDQGDFIYVDPENMPDVKEKTDEPGSAPKSKSRVWRSPFSIASDVSLLAARTCSGVGFLESKGLYSLGRHTSSVGLGFATFSLFMVSSACSAVDLSLDIAKDVRTLQKSESLLPDAKLSLFKSLRGRCYELFCDLFDLLVTPIDFGFWMLGGVNGAIIGSVLLLFSSILNFFRHFV